MRIQYKNYTVERADQRNWEVKKTTLKTAQHDMVKKDGTLIRSKGDEYEKVDFCGFYSDVGSALSGVVRDLAGVDCASIEDLALQLAQITSDLEALTTKKY